MIRRHLPDLSVLVAASSLALYACTSSSGGGAPPEATATPSPSAVAATATPAASPTATPSPTQPPTPTATPSPTQPPTPTATPWPAPAPAVEGGAPAAGHSAVWSGEANGNGAPWFTCRITPGEDPERDDWTVEVGATTAISFSCRPERDGQGLRLVGCSGLPGGYSFSARQADAAPAVIDVTFVQPTFGSERRFDASLTQAWTRDEAQASTNVALEWQRDAAESFGPYTDVWAGDGLAFAPHSNGVIEILDGASGEELGLIQTADYGPSQGIPSWVTDVKSSGSLLYAATVIKGILIFDVSDPSTPALVGQYVVPGGRDSIETFTNIHNITLSPDGDTIYAINQSHRRSDLRLIDVSDPSAPRELGRYLVPGAQSVFDGVHDLYVGERDGREIAFVNALQSGLIILDVTDPADLVTLSTLAWDGIFSHSGWAFEAGGRHYYANNDEGYDQGVTIFDVTDLKRPEIVSEYFSRPGISVHNVEIVEGIAYLSYYLDGLRVLDLRDPANPREIGHFDTVGDSDERDINQGAWGVHVADGRVYISDRETGIYAFEVEIPPLSAFR